MSNVSGPGSGEVIAVMRHWIEQAVIGLNLCPFAKAVYVKNQVRFVVSEAQHVDGFLEELDRELDLLAATDPQEIDTTLLIHPTLFADFLDFNDLTAIAEDAIAEHDFEGVLQIASFHPRFQFEGTAPDDLGNYTNRAPYPTLHLLREASIARAVEAFPEAETIYERNIETLRRIGHCRMARTRPARSANPALRQSRTAVPHSRSTASVGEAKSRRTMTSTMNAVTPTNIHGCTNQLTAARPK